MLRLLPKYKHFLVPNAQITDLTDLINAKVKFFLLAQSETIPVESMHLKVLGRFSGYLLLIGAGGISRYLGRIEGLVKLRFETKKPVIFIFVAFTWNRC